MKSLLFRLLIWGGVLGCSQGGMTPEEKLAMLLPDALPTIPVTGQVLVDGAPVKDIWVYLVPKGTEIPKGEQPATRARTDEQGNFAMTTYMEGDGAPQGDYVVCMEWLRFRQTGGMWIGPDKLGKKYSDPKTSTWEVTVVSEDVKLPTFELSTSGVTVPAAKGGAGKPRK